jgi:hypothetical protein
MSARPSNPQPTVHAVWQSMFVNLNMVTHSCALCAPAPEDVSTSSKAARIERLKMVDQRIEMLRNELARLLSTNDSAVMSDTLHAGFRTVRSSAPMADSEEALLVKALGGLDEDDSRPPTRT